MILALQVPEQDAKNMGHHLLMHEEDEEGMIIDLKQEKDDVNDKQVPDKDNYRIRHTIMWSNR